MGVKINTFSKITLNKGEKLKDTEQKDFVIMIVIVITKR